MSDETSDEVLEALDFDPDFHRLIDTTTGYNVGLAYRVVEALTRLADPELESEDAILDTLLTECDEHALLLYLLEQLQHLQDRIGFTPAEMAKRIGQRELDT